MLRTHQTFKEGRKRVTIQYMPAGESVIDATVNGNPARRTVRVNAGTAKRLQEDLEAAHARSEAGKAARPCGYFDHRAGASSFRPLRFIDGGERGVLLEVELTEAGRKALEGGDYAYFSPAFRRDRQTGEVLGLRSDTVEVGSFVNDPAFQTIEAIAAARAMEEEAEGEENVYTARPLAFSKEKQSKKFPPAEFYEDDEEGGEEEPEEEQKPATNSKAPAETEEQDGAFLKEWKNRKKKPARKDETASASRTFMQAWGQHQEEMVAASNPSGCNQYGHEWKEKHGPDWKPSGESGNRIKIEKKSSKGVISLSDASEKKESNRVDKKGEKSVHGGAMNDKDKDVRRAKNELDAAWQAYYDAKDANDQEAVNKAARRKEEAEKAYEKAKGSNSGAKKEERAKTKTREEIEAEEEEHEEKTVGPLWKKEQEARAKAYAIEDINSPEAKKAYKELNEARKAKEEAERKHLEWKRSRNL